MRIKIFMTTILEHAGGFEKYLARIASDLSHDKSYEITIVTMDENFTKKLGSILSFYYLKRLNKNPMKRETSNRVLTTIGKAKYKKCRSLSELKHELRSADIIYSKNELIESIILKFIVRYKTCRSVIFCCGTPLSYNSSTSLQAKIHNKLYQGRMYKILTSGASAFHVKNNTDLTILNKTGRKHIYKIYNAIDIENIQYNNIHHKLDLKDKYKKRFRIGWVGRLTEQKGVDTLLEIVEQLNVKYSKKISWHIAGEGDYSERLRAVAGRTSNVNFYGHIENRYIPNFLDQMDLFVCTSRWESFGNSIIEAMSMNLPIISFDIPGPNELIVDGKSGLLVNSITSLVEGIENAVNGHSTYDNGQEFVKSKFSRKKIVQEIKDMFNETLARQV